MCLWLHKQGEDVYIIVSEVNTIYIYQYANVPMCLWPHEQFGGVYIILGEVNTTYMSICQCADVPMAPQAR